jgi:multicomponent K+:H+ antiporter subunit D
MFAIMTKVGVYAVVRVWTLFFPSDGASSAFGADALVAGGLVTLAFGTLGIMATQRLGRLAGYSVIVSSGTLLAAVGFGVPALTGGALYYLASSTLAVAALYLLVELVERARSVEVAPTDEEAEDDYPLPFALERLELPQGVNLDDDEEALVGKTFPAATVFLGLSFIACALLVAGLPPLSGFVAKVAMLAVLLGLADAGGAVSAAAWALVAALIGSGLLSMIALSRAGIRHFWAPHDRPPPRLRVVECVPIAALVVACAVLTIRAEPAYRYAMDAAQALHQPGGYIDAVMSARPVPPPSARLHAAVPEESR